MDKESCRILDYYSILERISQECSSPLSAEKLKEEFPVADRGRVSFLLDLTQEWRGLPAEVNLGFGELADVEGIFFSAFEKARGISPQELYHLSLFLSMASETEKAVEKLSLKYPITFSLASGLGRRIDLAKHISKTVDKDGFIKDSASPELAKIRKQISVQAKSLSKNAKNLCEKYKDSLQENFITQRSERYVLAVKTEKQRHLGGLVHDVSESGSTVFMEPFELVEENNRLQRLLRDEHWEIKRILRALTEEVLEAKEDLLQIYERVCQLDCALAKARFSERFDGVKPAQGTLNLSCARHPLLCILKGKDAAIPLDFKFPEGKKAVLISGPNAGGKTIALKTIGITFLLSYIGIHPPVSEGTTIPFDLEVICDGGDRQSIEEDISTFTARLRRWNMIWDSSGPNTLVLIDEIGSSTDPSKGAALAASFMEALVDKGSCAIATTNIVQLKATVENLEKISNASMDINIADFEPTYRLTMGVPGSSYTFEIAGKYGFSKRIIEKALSMMPGEQLSYEKTVEELKKTLEKCRISELEIETELSRQKVLSRKIEEAEASIKEREGKILGEAKAEKESIVSETRKKAEEIIKELRESKASKKSIDDYRRAFIREDSKTGKKKTDQSEFTEGDRVFVKSLNAYGEVLKKERGRYLIKTGKVKILSFSEDLAISSLKDEEISSKKVLLSRDREFSTSIDFRGLDSETAIERLDVFLDDAVFAGHPFVTVIHGIGTGKLKKRIKEYLRVNKIKFRAGLPNEGGDGVTVLFLK